MKNFTIENDTNNITVYGSAKEADAAPNSERFTSEAALLKLAANWPTARLVEIWNSLPGANPVSKFKNRSTGVARIWKAIQTLGEAAEEQTPAEPETPFDLPATVADVAPQPPGVAPAEPPAEEGTTSVEEPAAGTAIDRDDCAALLKAAAVAQHVFWDALRELEQAIGFEIDNPGDLAETTIDDLIAKNEARRKPKTRAKGTRENSKTSQVIAMLKRERGTTLEEIMSAMGWLKHTTRAMLSAGGSLTKKHGLVIVSEKVGDKRVYSIKS